MKVFIYVINVWCSKGSAKRGVGALILSHLGELLIVYCLNSFGSIYESYHCWRLGRTKEKYYVIGVYIESTEGFGSMLFVFSIRLLVFKSMYCHLKVNIAENFYFSYRGVICQCITKMKFYLKTLHITLKSQFVTLDTWQDFQSSRPLTSTVAIASQILIWSLLQVTRLDWMGYQV